MKSVIRILFLTALFLLIGCAVVFVLLGGPQTVRRRWHFDKLVQTNNHEAVLRTAVNVIQATTNEIIFNRDHLTNLPPQIVAMKPAYVFVTPGSMNIEFHGGFDHFGFKIEDRGDRWEMMSFSEHKHHVLVVMFKTETKKQDDSTTKPDPTKTNTLSP